MYVRTIIAAAVAAFVAGAAQSAVIDFTDRSVWTSGASTTTVAGAVVTLSSTGGPISFAQDFDRSATPACAGSGGVLACDSDGLGVVNDEITLNGAVFETVTVTFSETVRIRGFSFLDLYIAPLGGDLERAEAYFDGDTRFPLSFAAIEVFDGVKAGFRSVGFEPVYANSVTFRAARTNDDIGRADFALAAIDVAPVPLPAAGWMLLAGLGLLAARKRLGA